MSQDLENTETTQDNAPEATETQGSSLKLEGFFGVKAGMTSVYTDQGVRVPVTVLECTPWTVTQIKTKDKDGYEAVQISAMPKKLKSSLKAEIGHYKKAGFETGMRYSREIRQDLPEGLELGQKVDLTSFAKGDILKVSAVSKGKGFSGVVKRYNFAGGPATHGSGFHRRPGSIGNREFPGRVMPGKKMAGQYGNKLITTKGLEIVDILLDQNVLLVKGAIPGAKNTLVEFSKI
jgi:large subunit ribosomal protein L3